MRPFWTIRTRLVLSLLAVLTASMVAVGYLAARQYGRALNETRLQELENVADLKSRQIQMLTDGYRAELQLAQQYYNVKRHLPTLIAHLGTPRAEPAVAALDSQLLTYTTAGEYADFMLADPSGRVVYAISPDHKKRLLGRPLPQVWRDVFDRGREGIVVGQQLAGGKYG